jgi:hypothetical protein
MAIEREKLDIQRDTDRVARSRTVLSRTAPDFDSIFEEGENPLEETAFVGELQADANSEVSDILKAIIERRKAQNERFRITSDPEYFFCVCFQSRDQKDEFLKATHWDDLGNKFINGLEVARRMNVPVTVIELEPPKLRGRAKNFQREEVIGK